MLETHKGLFAKFRNVHDKYIRNPQRYQMEFNDVGTKVLVVIRNYENKLCRSTENSQYGKFSTKLSDKFWSGVRTIFPKIDFVGVTDD